MRVILIQNTTATVHPLGRKWCVTLDFHIRTGPIEGTWSTQLQRRLVSSVVPLHLQFQNSRQAKGILEENRPGCVCLRDWGVNLHVLSREIRRTRAALLPSSTSTLPSTTRTLGSQAAKGKVQNRKGRKITERGPSALPVLSPGIYPWPGTEVGCTSSWDGHWERVLISGGSLSEQPTPRCWPRPTSSIPSTGLTFSHSQSCVLSKHDH